MLEATRASRSPTCCAGPYRPPQYERVKLPMTVLRRFDCLPAPTKPKILSEHDRWSGRLDGEALDARLNRAGG